MGCSSSRSLSSFGDPKNLHKSTTWPAERGVVKKKAGVATASEHGDSMIRLGNGHNPLADGSEKNPTLMLEANQNISFAPVPRRKKAQRQLPKAPLFDQLPQQIRDNYEMMAVVGQGKWTDVYRVRDRDSMQASRNSSSCSLVPSKSGDLSTCTCCTSESSTSCPSENSPRSQLVVRALDTARIWRDEIDVSLLYRLGTGKVELSHPNVVKYFGLASDSRFVCLVSEFLSGGSALDRIYAYDEVVFPERHCAAVARQLFSGLAYLHENGIIHRNISSPQLLFEDEESLEGLKITDFEHAVKLPDGYTAYQGPPKWQAKLFRSWPQHWMVGSPHVVAPETLKFSHWTLATAVLGAPGNHVCAVDCWSAGVTIYELLYGAVPFFGRTKDELRQAITCCPPDIQTDEVSYACADFLQKLLHKDPRKRMTAKQALQHPWLQDTDNCVAAWLADGAQGSRSDMSRSP